MRGHYYIAGLALSMICATGHAQTNAEQSVVAHLPGGEMYEQAARTQHLDPLLLYAVALTESARKRDDGTVAPWPWTLRTVSTPYYAPSREAAKQKLREMMDSSRYVDVGYMQVNISYHGNKVSSPEALLDPRTNLRVGAAILRDAIRSAPGDLALGIGHYFNSDDQLARNYGNRVIAVWRNLSSLYE